MGSKDNLNGSDLSSSKSFNSNLASDDIKTNINLEKLEKPANEIHVYVNKDGVAIEEEYEYEFIERCRKCGKKRAVLDKDNRTVAIFKDNDSQTPALKDVLNDLPYGQMYTGSTTSFPKGTPLVSLVINKIPEKKSSPSFDIRENFSDDEVIRSMRNDYEDSEDTFSHQSQNSQSFTLGELLERVSLPTKNYMEHPKEDQQVRGSWKINTTISFVVLASLSIYSLIELDKLRPTISYANGTFMVFAIYSMIGVWVSYIESRTKNFQQQQPDFYTKALVAQLATAVPYLTTEMWLSFFKDDRIHQYAGHFYACTSAIPLVLCPILGFQGVRKILIGIIALGLGAIIAISLIQESCIGVAAVIAYAISFITLGNTMEDVNGPKQTFVNICNCAFVCLSLATLQDLYLTRTNKEVVELLK